MQASAQTQQIDPSDRSAGLTRAAALRQMDAETRRTRFIFVIWTLDAQRAAEALEKHRNQQWKRTHWRDTPLVDALSHGVTALKEEARQCAKEVRDRGDLLFAFEGSTLLRGGA